MVATGRESDIDPAQMALSFVLALRLALTRPDGARRIRSNFASQAQELPSSYGLGSPQRGVSEVIVGGVRRLRCRPSAVHQEMLLPRRRRCRRLGSTKCLCASAACGPKSWWTICYRASVTATREHLCDWRHGTRVRCARANCGCRSCTMVRCCRTRARAAAMRRACLQLDGVPAVRTARLTADFASLASQRAQRRWARTTRLRRCRCPRWSAC